MTSGLRVRLGAVVLAATTLAAIVFGAINFQQRSTVVVPDDGVSWLDTGQGVVAWHVTPGSPADSAGIKPNDRLLALNGSEVRRAVQVTQRLWHAGVWSEVTYKVARDGRIFEAKLVTIPADKPFSLENYLRVVGLLYLFIGLFIFARRWNAARAVHFYVFCLTSFILYAFQFSGKLSIFDWEVYWASVVARLLQPALLLHFAMVFPERRTAAVRQRLTLACVYGLPALLLLVHIFVATQVLGFVPSLENRITLDQFELVYLGAYFLLAATIFLLSYRRTPSGLLRQQLKWVTGGTLAGTVPFLLLYIVPYFWGVTPQVWMKLSAVTLALIPLCFGYAIIRYRLMDVDIIFRRGLAYTAAGSSVLAVYIALVAALGALFHTAQPSGIAGEIIAILVAAFLFQPFRDWIQGRLDRYFYRDRLDYRRTLIEFGRTLTNEVHLDPMLASVMDRISQTLLVDRIAIFIENPETPGHYQLNRSMGVRANGPLDLSFLDADKDPFARGCLF